MRSEGQNSETIRQARLHGFREALSEKGGVDAVRVVAFAYDINTNGSNDNGMLRATLMILQINFQRFLSTKKLRPQFVDGACFERLPL